MSWRAWGALAGTLAVLLLVACGETEGAPVADPTTSESPSGRVTEWQDVELEEISDDGRHLRLMVFTTPCFGDPEFDRMSEEADRVVIHLVRTSPPASEGEECHPIEQILHVEVDLDEPLGDRRIEVRTQGL